MNALLETWVGPEMQRVQEINKRLTEAMHRRLETVSKVTKRPYLALPDGEKLTVQIEENMNPREIRRLLEIVQPDHQP